MQKAEAPYIPPFLKDILVALSSQCEEPAVFKTIFFDVMASQNDPLFFVLDLMWYGEVFSRKKHSWMMGKIAKVLKEWCQMYDVSWLMTKQIRLRALDVAVDINDNSVIKQLCEIFNLVREKEYAKNIIYHMLATRNFKKAYNIVSALNMEQEYHINEIVFPLFFMGNEDSVKKYLIKVPHYQYEFVKALDELKRDSQIKEFIRFVNAENLHPNKKMMLNNKWIMKRLPAYMELFKIDIEFCPNMYNTRIAKSMHYLFRKKFVEESIEYEPWLELTLDLISEHKFLQKELIVKLVSINEAQLAMNVAVLLDMNLANWPDCLKCVPKSIARFEYIEPPPSDVSDKDYLQLRLKKSDIHFVDTPVELLRAVEDISKNYNVLGMDVEWKPDMGIALNTGYSRADLLQLAVWDAIYLIDVLALTKTGDSSIWLPMLEKIFYNKDMLKLGFGTTDDMKYLLKTINHEKDPKKEMPRIIDLSNVFKKVKDHFPELNAEINNLHPILPTDNPNTKGLSQLCRTVLGKFLNKSEQFSHWARRPLRESQIEYAALDAYCLLMVCETIYPILKKHNLDLEKILTSKPPAKQGKSQKEKSKVKHEPIKVTDFRVVVDNHVRGIIKYLRVLGADVACLEENQDNMDAVKIAQKEHRIVITGIRQYKKIIGYLPEEMCFYVDGDLNARAQVVQVLQHFNVICEDSALLSRCTEETTDPNADKPLLKELKAPDSRTVSNQVQSLNQKQSFNKEMQSNTTQIPSNQSPKQNVSVVDLKQVATKKNFPSQQKIPYKDLISSHKQSTADPKQELNVQSTASPNQGQNTQSTASSNQELKKQSTASPKPGLNKQSTTSPKHGQNKQSTANPNQELHKQSTASPKPGQNKQSTANSNQELHKQSTASPKPGQNKQSTTSPKPGQNEQSTANPNQELHKQSTATPQIGPNKQSRAVNKPASNNQSTMNQNQVPNKPSTLSQGEALSNQMTSNQALEPSKLSILSPVQDIPSSGEVLSSEKENVSHRVFQEDIFSFEECDSSEEDLDDLYYG